MTRIFTLAFWLTGLLGFAQDLPPGPLSYAEYMGLVQLHHPTVKQANLELTAAQAALLAARGAFDPKIEADLDRKEFKNKTYYDLLNSSFKIPTWYGIELKAAFDNAEGVYVNPQNLTPNNGLTSLGISVPVGQGLLINQRMADLRKAKVQVQLSKAERQLQIAEALYQASEAYFGWRKAYAEFKMYQSYLEVAQTRSGGIQKLIDAGDRPAIDSVEAAITVNMRRMAMSEAELKLAKARLAVSNFIWIGNVPVELREAVIPEDAPTESVISALGIAARLDGSAVLDNHPKLQALRAKRDMLEIERRLKANSLLPKVDLSYHVLSEPNQLESIRTRDYKFGLDFAFPLFLRKERGQLKLAQAKLLDTELELGLQQVVLRNKLQAQQAEIKNVAGQMEIQRNLVDGYQRMVAAEERLFTTGESSLFLINSRENSLVSAKLGAIDLENRYLRSYAELFRIWGGSSP